MTIFRPHKQRALQRCRKRSLALLMMVLSLPMSVGVQAQNPARERFVPVDKLGSIFERTPRGIMLQRDKFEELLKKAQEAQKDRAELPADVVVRSAHFLVTQEDSHAVIDATIDIEQYQNDWV